MSEFKKVIQKKSEEVKQPYFKHQRSGERPGLNSWEDRILTDTPFYPDMGRHTLLLSHARSDKQRTNLVQQLQQTYGNAYVQRLLESNKVRTDHTINPLQAISDISVLDSMKNAWKESFEEKPVAVEANEEMGPAQGLLDSTVRDDMKSAWRDSVPYPGPYEPRHEEGGWIVNTGGYYEVIRWPNVGRGECYPSAKPEDKNVVAAYHTHPNPEKDEKENEWEQYPSAQDQIWTREQGFSEESYIIGLRYLFYMTPNGSWDFLGDRESALG